MNIGILNILLITLFCSTSLYSQKKPKIKGDRNVIEINEIIGEDFNAISLEDGLEVDLYVANTPSYTIEADENISKIINVRVLDGTLKVSTDYRIQNKKKLNIKLTVNSINAIYILDNSKLIGKSKIETDSIRIEGKENARFDLDINTPILETRLVDNAGGTIKGQAVTSSFSMTDRADVSVYLSATTLIATLTDSATITLEGNAEDATYKIEGSAKVKAEKLPTFRAVLNCSGSSQRTLHTTEFIEIYATEKSKINLYGEPEIDLKELKGQSSITKKM